MDKLRLLDINDVRLTGNFKHIFEELRWLSWRSCDLQCLPSDFHPEKLVILDLRFSKISILWHGILFLEQLKILNLYGCVFLTTTPDFTGVPNLEKLHIGRCTRLAEIHPSIEHLSRLACLDLSSCQILRCIPNSICNLRALESLNISSCSNLEELPEELGNIESLRELLANNSGIFKIPDSIGRLSRLVNLNLESCKNLRTLPSSLCNLRVLESLCLNDCDNLEEFPEELGNIESLKVLKAGNKAIKIPDSIGRLSRLVTLNLKSCINHRTLPSSLCNLRVLESLCLNDCLNLEELPEELGNIESLLELKADSTAITKLPDSIGSLSRLVNLNLKFCTKLRTLPSSLCNLRVLESLCLHQCNNLEELPDELGNIESLLELNASFTAITKLPDSIGRLSRLVHLELLFCKNLRTLPSSLCNLRVLKSLDLQDCGNLEELPDELGNIESLKKLQASSTAITNLPYSIGRLTKLSELNLVCCRKLKKFPSNIGSLSSLKRLDLRWCEISDGNLLDNIGSLSSLVVLKLSSNIFTTLPSSLGQLSNLEELELEDCLSLLSVQKLPPNLVKLFADGCTSMERLPNLSNLKHLEALYLLGCSRLVEIQGLEKLTSIRRIDLEGCNNLAITFEETFFQVYSGFGNEIWIYLPTGDFPDWVGHQTKGTCLGPNWEDSVNVSTICFDVPQNSENKFLGMILWVVSSNCLHEYTDTLLNSTLAVAIVENKTNGNKWTGYLRQEGVSSWVSLIPKTRIAVKFGDKIEASIRRQRLVMDRLGVHLVYKTDTIENY